MSSGRRRRASEVEARKEASTGGVRRDGRDAIAADTASGEGGAGLGLRRKRWEVRRDLVEKGRWLEREAGAGGRAARRRWRRIVVIAIAPEGEFERPLTTSGIGKVRNLGIFFAQRSGLQSQVTTVWRAQAVTSW